MPMKRVHAPLHQALRKAGLRTPLVVYGNRRAPKAATAGFGAPARRAFCPA